MSLWPQPIRRDGGVPRLCWQPASQTITVGETYDFELVPDHPGEFRLQVSMRFLKTIISQSVTVR